MTERIAIVDIGSNSARLIVMNMYSNGAYNLVYHQKETIRLGEGVETDGYLQEDAMQRTVETAKNFAHMCNLSRVDKIYAVATAAVRNAKNGPAFLELVKERSGIPLQAISGKEEARLGYIAVVDTLDIVDALLFDLGGGSTELTLIKNRKMNKTISLPFGAVSLTEKFRTQNKIDDTKLADLYDYIMGKLTKVPWLSDLYLPLVGIGGTARNIAKMDQKRKNYPFTRVHNYRLGDMSFKDLWQSLAAADLKQRFKFPGLSRERADIIVAGTTIIQCLFDISQANRLIVSGCGVREGLWTQHYLSKSGLPEIIPDVLMHSTKNMLLFCKGNVDHANHVTKLAVSIFDGLQDLHELEERDRKLLQVSGLLHDIGITINYYDHPRHSAYLVENARLFGLTHREQMLTAVIAGWHHGPAAKQVRNRLYSEFLDETDWQKARKLALFLALAESLDATEMHLTKKAKISYDKNNVYFDITIDEHQGYIELNQIKTFAKWFKKEFDRELQLRPNFKN